MVDVLENDAIGSLAYSISVDGSVMEIVSADDPFEYLHGAENIVPGLEAALNGKRVGDTFDVTVPPEVGFGDYNEDAVIEVDREEFEDDDEELTVGTEVEMMDEDGDFLDGTILEITDTHYLVDTNHPLAGKTVHYKGSIVSIREATEEELEWGWPESTLDELFGDEEFDDEHEH